jgi:methane/ammonia monooxygenase subunit B
MVKSKMLIVMTLAAVTVLSAIAAYMPIIPEADAHGVQAQLQSRFIRIEDESWTAQTVNTGDEITVTGTLQSLVNRPLRAWLSVFSESTNAGNRWEFMSRDPPGNVFELNVASVGPGLGPGQTVQVTGEAILKPVPWGNVFYQVILIGAGLGVTFATRPWQVI